VGLRDYHNKWPKGLQQGKSRFVFVPEMDAFEPNNKAENAKPLRIGQEAIVAIYPRWDRDNFSIEVERDGELVLVPSGLPKGLALRLWVADASGKVLRDSEQLSVRVKKGRHTVRITDQRSVCKAEGFRIKLVLR